MIKVFYGDDRVRAQREIVKFLGTKDYEIIEGSELTPEDLPNIFAGATLFGKSDRRILIRDFFAADKETQEQLAQYINTPHRVAFLESKVDKRLPAYKTISRDVEFYECKAPEPDKWLAFDIYNTAKRDGKKALEMYAKIQNTADVKMLVAQFASQAMKDYAARPGAKEKRALVELSRLDNQLSDRTISPQLLLQAFLLELSSLLA